MNSGSGSSSTSLSGLDDSQLGSFDSTAESIPDSTEQNDLGITYVSPGELESQQSDIQQLEPQICQHGQQQDRPDYVKGACAFQLTQYLYQQRHRPTDNNIEFWHKFVSDFFTNDAKKRLCVSAYLNRSLSSDSTGSSQGWHCEFCNQKAFRGYEAIAEALPRLFQIKYERPTLEELLYVDMPHESQNSSGQVVLRYEQARQEGVYENLRMIRDGQLRVVFSPDLKIGSWEFCAQRHEELIPRNLIKTKARQLVDAAQKCRFSSENALWLFEPGLENTFIGVNESASHLTEALETSLFTGYGYSLRYIRYLQVLMIDNSLQEAMDFSRVSGKGPMGLFQA
ncbi:transcriptional corepressor SEUSS-like isoform X2 [Mercurialis annua]|uniref:transcriptional corepressor SEUSS-like isoform X2 n=1 Tax=Mercurialis annua TaxID=3986 RepID=UPI00215F3A0F|nr:transcriptional corepressor SEUSS-like isoform X2 [Mercurialis annua]